MIRKIKKFFKAIIRYENDMAYLLNRVADVEKVIRDRTDIHADIHYKSENQVILVGRFRNRDFVQMYNVQSRDFIEFINHLKELEKYGHIAKLDCPPGVDAVFKHEFL